MATFTTYAESNNIFRDVAPVVQMLDNWRTPFLSMASSVSVKNRFFEWQWDQLDAVSVATTALTEGQDMTYSNVAAPTLASNYSQIFAEAIAIADTARYVTNYGISKMESYALYKASLNLKRAVEYTYIGQSQVANAGSTTAAGGGANTARQSASYDQLIVNSNITVTAGSNSTVANVFSMTDLLTCAQEVYQFGGEPDVLIVTPNNAITVSQFAESTGRYRQIQDNEPSSATTLVNVIDVLKIPFNDNLKVVTDRYLFGAPLSSHTANASVGAWTLLVDTSLIAEGVLQNWTRTPLARTGLAEKVQVSSERGLLIRNPQGAGLICEGLYTGTAH